MGITVEELSVLLEAKDSNFAATFDRAGYKVEDFTKKTEAAGSAADKSGSRFNAMAVPIFNVAYAARMAVGYLGLLAGVIEIGSGVKLAAQLQGVEVGYTRLFHRVKSESRAFIRDMKALSLHSPFEVMALLAAGRPLIAASGGSEKGAAKDMRILANVGAATGMNESAIGSLALQLAKIQEEPRGMPRKIEALTGTGVSMMDVVKSGGGPQFKSNMLAEAFLSTLSGPQAKAMIMKGLDKLFEGAAEEMTSGTLLGLVSKIRRSLSFIMEPTGELLLGPLQAAGTLIGGIAGAVRSVNEVTGGSAGLIFMLYGLYRAKTLLVTSARAAWVGINQLTASIERLAAVSGGAAVATSASAGGGALGFLGLAALGSGKGGLKGMLGGLVKSPVLALLAADIGLGYVGQAMGNRAGDVIGGVGRGALLGGMVGSVVPGIGTAAGAGIGALAGGFYEFFHGEHSTLSAIEKNTRDTADSILQIKGRLTGGGDRAGRAAAEIEGEIRYAETVFGGPQWAGT